MYWKETEKTRFFLRVALLPVWQHLLGQAKARDLELILGVQDTSIMNPYAAFPDVFGRSRTVIEAARS